MNTPAALPLGSMMTDLRRHLFTWLPLPTAFLALYSYLLVSRVDGLQPALLGWAALAVMLSAGLAQWLAGRRLRSAIAVYLAGLALAASLLVWLHFAGGPIIALSAMLVLLAMNLLGLAGALPLALWLTGVIGATAAAQDRPATDLLAPLGSLWLTLLVAWLSNRNLILALAWAWNSYDQAHALTDQARRHRAELAQALKELDNAYYRLERFSVQLAHARTAAEEAKRTKQQFVANVSHELRTPLNIIIGFSEAIALSPESYGVHAAPRPFMGDVNRIYRSAQHLKNLIDDVLDLSKMDAQHLPLFLERAEPAAVSAEVVDMIAPLAAQKGIALRVAAAPDLPPVLLDRLRVRQVLLNLLSNALRFTQAGSIDVTLARVGEAVQVDVADTGPGIPPENLALVFEEFYQVDAQLAKHYDGTGLGLALSRRFVELHGGRMWVESTLGRGSCFSFTLPLAPPQTADYAAAARPLLTTQQEARHGTVVLALTDEPMGAHFLKRHLQDFQVRHVQEADLADAVATFLPRAVVCSEVLDSPPALPVPLITCPLPSTRHVARQLGVDRYLVKPIGREQIHAILADYGDRVAHVLVVDDDPQLCELVARMVRAAPRPYSIETACGGPEGLERMRARRPDLVLLDLLMPGLDGLGVLQTMRGDPTLHAIPVVMVTAQDLPDADLPWAAHAEIKLTVPEGLQLAQALRCLQVLLDVMPVPTPRAAPPPALPAVPSRQPVS
jgi:signal transduction histidine kinase/CheY-like chemotaxis protein